MSSTESHTLQSTGATIAYDIRRAADAQALPLFMVGSPMEGSGFTSLASYFTDRTVITYDPRGVGRSTRTDQDKESTPEQHAEDLRRIIEAVNGPVDLFGSSGGAVNGLALVARHPQLVQTFVAHEPPTAVFLSDRQQMLAAVTDICDTYQRSGIGPAMAKFLTLITHQGPLPADYADQPNPDPAAYGLPTIDDGSRNDPMIGQNMRTASNFEPDLAALTAATTQIVIGSGQESRNEMTGRAAASVAAQLRTDLTIFPSHHGGFLGGEFGQQGQPAEFAATLHRILDPQLTTG